MSKAVRAEVGSPEAGESAPPERGARRAELPQASPLRPLELVLCALLYGALGIWWLWPLPSLARTYAYDFTAKLDLVQADYQLISWALSWGAHALVHAPLDLFRGNIFFPSTLALAYTDHFLGYAPLYAPIFWLTNNPVLSTNVLVIALQPLCALGMYAFARRFVEPPAALLAGLLFGFMPWRLSSLPHYHMLGIQYLPLALLFTERWLDTAKARDAVLLALCLALQATSSAYLAYALSIAYAAYLPLAWWGFRRSLDRRRLVGLAAAVAAAGAVVVLLGIPYVRLRQVGMIPAYDDPTSATPFGLMAYTVGMAMSDFFRSQSFGWAAYGLSAIALLPPWRGRGRAVLIGVCLVVLATMLAYGPDARIGSFALWTPYRLLMRLVPGFSSIRLPVRFVVVTQVGMSLLAALGLAAITSLLPRFFVWPAAVVALALAAWSAPLPRELPPLVEQPFTTRLPPEVAWLAEHGDGRSLLELPPSKFSERTHRMLLSTFHWLPLVDGYSGYTPRSADLVFAAARGLPTEKGLSNVLDLVDLGWILVHLDQIHGEARATWERALPPGLEVAGRWDNALLLRVTRRGDPARQARLFDPARTLEGTPLARVGDRCPGELRLISAPPQPWPTNQPAHVSVEVRNDSDQPWPAHGALPRHLLMLTACLGKEAAENCRSEPTPLPADVPAHGSVQVEVSLSPPVFAGERTLSIDLMQRGDGWLDRCGLHPLRTTVTAAYPPRS